MNTNEVRACLECAQRGIFQQIHTGRAVCSCCRTVAPATIEPRKFWETAEQFTARVNATVAAMEAALVEAAPVEVVEAPAPPKVRCVHYPVIREFFAIAREMGFDTSKEAKDRWRGAMGVYLGVRIQSRAELSAAQWRNAITGLRAGVLFI